MQMKDIVTDKWRKQRSIRDDGL